MQPTTFQQHSISTESANKIFKNIQKIKLEHFNLIQNSTIGIAKKDNKIAKCIQMDGAGWIQDAKTFKTELSRIAKLNGLYEEIYTASHFKIMHAIF